MLLYNCFHCNKKTSGHIKIFNKFFCCQGCKTVYEILHENGLDKFYDLNHSPGITPNKKNIYQFDFIDTKSIREKLIDFDDGNITSVRFFIPSIHCTSCIWLLENLPNIQPFILSSKVDFRNQILNVVFKKKYKLSHLAHFLNKIGYKPIFNLKNFEKKKKYINRHFFYKIVISFFCFFNIMLLSFPEYLNFHRDIWLNNNKYFFRFIILLLSFPVIFYSSTDFFKSAFTSLLQKKLHIDVPIALGILVLFLRSFYEIITDYGSGYFDSFSGLVFFMLLGRFFQIRTYKSLVFDCDYKSFYPIAVTKICNKKEKNILLSDLKKGDHILIRNEEIIPADVILISSESFIDNSFITGESRLILYKSGDRIYAGGRHKGSIIEVKVIEKVEKSRLIQLWNQNIFKKPKIYFNNLVNKWSHYFTLTIFIISIFTSIYWYFFNKTIIFQSFCSVLIIACPCALALSTPFILGNIMRILSKEGFYVRNIQTIERIAKINTLVFDKTGTLTESEGIKINYKGVPLNKIQNYFLASLFKNSKHPLSRALYNYLNKRCKYFNKKLKKKIKNFKEFPGKGLQAYIGDCFIKAGSSDYVGIKKKVFQNFIKVFISINKNILGYFILRSRYRNGLKNLFKELNNYSISIISGDNNAEMSFLKSILPLGSKILFWKNPKKKLDYITELQKNNYNVMMFGDGLNDAGAIKKSNVGITISENINNFSPDCDVIIKANKFHKISYFLKLSRISTKLVIVSFLISLFYNIIGLSFAISGNLKPLIAALLMPISSLSVIFFSIISTSISVWYLKK